MSSGDEIQAGRITTAESTTDLVGAVPSEGDVDFNGAVILRVGPQQGKLSPGTPLDGIHGIAALAFNGRTPRRGGAGVVGFGGGNEGTGVRGLGGAASERGDGGLGVHGIGGDGTSGGFGKGPFIVPGTGVLGAGGKPDPEQWWTGGIGVMGVAGGPADGVVGICEANDQSGVYGFNSKKRGAAFGVSGNVGSPDGAGVSGFSDPGTGVIGTSNKGNGVYGTSNTGAGVLGVGHIGVHAQSTGVNGVAVGAWGNVIILGGNLILGGDLIVTGAKNAAIPHRDGSHRLLYCVESPESWFEDFGEAKLVKGRANVKLEAGFLSVVKMDRYHVFLTPYGESNGLYVSHRGKKGFEVRERSQGKSSVVFSYRIVAKRANIDGRRFAKVKLAKPPLVRPPTIPKPRPVAPPAA